MSPFEIAIAVLFASLGLVAFALGMLARRYSRLALGTGLVGLLSLTTASTWIAVAGTPTEVANLSQVDIDRMLEEQRRSRDRIKELEKLIDDGGGERARVSAAVTRLEAELVAERTKRNAAERDAKEARDARETARSTVPGPSPPPTQVAGHAGTVCPTPAPVTATLAPPPCSAQPSSPTAQQPRTEVSQRPAGPGGVGLLLAKETETSLYAATPLAQRELVRGLKGEWYTIRLKPGGRPMIFGDRRFGMTEVAEEFNASARQLQADILAPLAKSAKKYRLFVRGYADDRRVAGPTETPAVREMLVLPRSANGTYPATPQRLSVAATVTNEQLPNLRAGWLRERIAGQLGSVGSAEIDILANPPSRNAERTADLVLYVEW